MEYFNLMHEQHPILTPIVVGLLIPVIGIFIANLLEGIFDTLSAIKTGIKIQLLLISMRRSLNNFKARRLWTLNVLCLHQKNFFHESDPQYFKSSYITYVDIDYQERIIILEKAYSLADNLFREIVYFDKKVYFSTVLTILKMLYDLREK